LRSPRDFVENRDYVLTVAKIGEQKNGGENQDFCSFLSESSGGRPSKEYHISLLV